MGKQLVELIGSGFGLASEAISLARNSSPKYPPHYDNFPSRDLTMDQNGEFVFADEKATGELRFLLSRTSTTHMQNFRPTAKLFFSEICRTSHR